MRRHNIIDVLAGPARLLERDGSAAPGYAVLSRDDAQALVDPRTIRYTGLTRDGTYLIENGKLTRRSRTSASTTRRCSC